MIPSQYSRIFSRFHSQFFNFRHLSKPLFFSTSIPPPPPSPPSPSPPYQYEKIAFVGAGKMAEALLSPLLSTHLQPASRISLHDPSSATLHRLSTQYPGVHTTPHRMESFQHAELIILAVKPQTATPLFLETLWKDVEQFSENQTNVTLLSVMAGVPMHRLAAANETRKIVRSMPNTPAMIGEGMTVWTCTDTLETEEQSRIATILSSFGKAVRYYTISSPIFHILLPSSFLPNVDLICVSFDVYFLDPCPRRILH